MPKENASKPDLKHVVAHIETKPEVEGKYLLFRKQVDEFILNLKRKEAESGVKKVNEFKIEQRWIVGGENDGIRLRKKISQSGEEKMYITKKEDGVSGNGAGFTGEKEIEIQPGDAYYDFFIKNWSTSESVFIKKMRYEFDYIVDGSSKKVELDVFDGTDMTYAEVEFSGNTVDDALKLRSNFKSRKFFKSLGLDSVKIGYDDKRFKNKSMAKNKVFLDKEYVLTAYYKKLIKRVENSEKYKEKIKRKKAKKKAKDKDKI